MSKHTPGPWTLELIQERPFGFKIVAGDYVVLQQDAICHSSGQKTRADCEDGVGFFFKPKGNGTSRDQAAAMIARQDADARLIAAAPELLEWCKAALNMVDGDGMPPNWDGMRAAIAAATGEPPK